jgi:hypothetical protein
VSTDVSPRDSKKPATLGHYMGVAAVAVIGAVVAFWVLSSIAGIIFFFVKVIAVVALIGVAFWVISRLRK